MTPTADEWAAIVGLLPLIRHIALRSQRLAGRVVDVDDMMQAGVLGAVHGLRTYDPERGDLQRHLAITAEGWMRHHALLHRGPVVVGHTVRGLCAVPVDAGVVHDPWPVIGRTIDGGRILARLRSSTHRGRRILAAWADGALDIEQAAREGVSKQRVAQLRVDALRRIQRVVR